jgi:hypothetical protein
VGACRRRVVGPPSQAGHDWYQRRLERQPGRGLPVEQRERRRGAPRRYDARNLVVHPTADDAGDVPAQLCRLPRLRANRRAPLREREHVDLARSADRHLAAPVRYALQPGHRQAASGRGHPASAASVLEGPPAGGTRHDRDGAQSPGRPETDAGIPRRRARPLRPAPRRDRADHRRRGCGPARSGR